MLSTLQPRFPNRARRPGSAVNTVAQLFFIAAAVWGIININGSFDKRDKTTSELNRLRAEAFALFTHGDYAKALPIYQIRKKAVEDYHGANSYEYGESLADLGRDELAMKHYSKAEKYLEDGMVAFRRPLRHGLEKTMLERWAIITAKNVMAQTYMAQKKFDQAEKCSNTAIQMCTADGYPNGFNNVMLSRSLRGENKAYQSRQILITDLKENDPKDAAIELAELAVISALNHKQSEADTYLKQWQAKVSDKKEASVAENDFKQLSTSELSKEVLKNSKPVGNVNSFDDLEPHVTLTATQFEKLISHKS